MKWADIRNLNPGDIIVYGDHRNRHQCSYIREGKVLHVTIKGGIRVAIFSDGQPTGEKQWVCYAHVIHFPRKPDRRRRKAA